MTRRALLAAGWTVVVSLWLAVGATSGQVAPRTVVDKRTGAVIFVGPAAAAQPVPQAQPQLPPPASQPAVVNTPSSQPATTVFHIGNGNGRIVVVGGGQVNIQGNIQGNVVVQGQVVIQPVGGIAVGQPIGPSSGPGPVPPVDPAAIPPAPADVGATLRTIDAEYGGVKVESILLTGDKGKPGSVRFTQSSGETRDLPIGDLVRVDIQPGARRPAAERIRRKEMAVLLTNGEWLVGVISGGDKRDLRIDLLGVGELSVPLRNVRAIVSPTALARRQTLDSLERSLLSPASAAPGEGEAASDTVRLANGEALAGTIIEVGGQGLLVSAPSGKLNVDFDVVTVAEMSNPADPVVSADSPTMAWVDLANGSRLLAGRMEWKNGSLSLTRPGSAVVIKPASESAQLVSIESVNGRWRWLDSQAPLLAEHRPFLTVKWPARFGVNVAGGPIKVGGKTCCHGLGVHSASRVIYDVKGATRFHCIGGFDASAGPAADVAVGVYLDGELVLERKSYKFADSPVAIDLPLKNAQKLELRVEFGPNGDVQARFDWADAAVIY